MREKHMKQLGFHIWCIGGVSRAWRRFQRDGSYLLVTDVGGYDLPELHGPYQAMQLTANDELVEVRSPIRRASRLVRWLGRRERLANGIQLAEPAVNDLR
jgi:hypothetical protein